jgi:hypothetical protein
MSCKLETLILKANNISDIGALHIAKSLYHNGCSPILKVLDLSKNHGISEKSYNAFAAQIAQYNSILIRCDLSST